MGGEENRDVVRRVLEAVSGRDIPTLLELSAPDVEFFAPATAARTRQGRSYRGHNGILRYMRDVARIWDELELIPHSFTDVDDNRVYVRGRMRARARGGLILDEQANWLVEVRDGKVVGSRPYAADVDTAELPVVRDLPDDAAPRKRRLSGLARGIRREARP
jgi:ketosteroid isomerase-like protein